MVVSRGFQVRGSRLLLVITNKKVKGMKLTNRKSVGFGINVLVLAVFLSGCIVVVKEDDEDRHRYLRDSEWTLEVVFYRTQTLTSADRTLDVQFTDAGLIEGTASCGGLNGTYEVNENDGITVSGIEWSEGCQGISEMEMISGGLQAANSYRADENELTISTSQNGFLSFSAK